MTRILVADDHEMIRQGLRKVLEAQPGWVVCGEAANGREAVAKTKELQPDVAVLDFFMPELNGLEATRLIRTEAPRSAVLILTMHESEQLAREALAAGARGFVLKSDAGTTLVLALEQILQGRTFFSAKVSQIIQEGQRPAQTAAGLAAGRPTLSARQREVLQLLAEGKSSKQVAETLGISVKTAETHRVNLMRKLGLHSVSEVVRYAIRNRIIEP